MKSFYVYIRKTFKIRTEFGSLKYPVIAFGGSLIITRLKGETWGYIPTNKRLFPRIFYEKEHINNFFADKIEEGVYSVAYFENVSEIQEFIVNSIQVSESGLNRLTDKPLLMIKV